MAFESRSLGWAVIMIMVLARPSSARYKPSAQDFARDKLLIQELMNVTSAVPPRLSNITAAEFQEYFQAGIPVIITDIADTWAMREWSCSSLAREFGEEEVMYWNYGEGAEHDKWHKMKTLAELTATSRPGQDKRTLKDSEAPKYLSFHWYPVQYGVGDEEILYDKYEDDYTSTLASPKARARIKGAYELPYFIEPNPMNLEFTKERIEFFIGMPGSGAAVHTDGVCEAIFSVQLSGVKRWRLSPLPPYTRAVQARAPDMQSGAWDPSFVFDLHPGEAVFFPPSLMHETKTVGDECSLSASLQIRYPFPVGHIRDFKTRLIHSQEVSFCFEHWAPFITGHKDGVREMYRQIIKGQDPNNVVQSFFNQIDTNRDGLASMPEKIRHFKWVIKQHRGQVEFTAAEEAKDWFAFNDVNKDGKVTFEEYKELQLDIQTTYATAIEQGACDEMGCHPNVKRDILAGKLNGIESAYIANHESGHDDEVELDEEYDPNKTVGHDEV